MRVVMFGAGGVGGYFGGRLAQAGVDLTFIARGAHLRAMQTEGFRVESDRGSFALEHVQATDDPATVGEVDLVLVATKSWQVPAAAEALRPIVGPETIVLPLLNGVDAPDELAAVLGEEPVLGGYCRVMSAITAPGAIRQYGIEPFIALGERDRRPSERVERVRALLTAAGINVEVPEDIIAAMWRKLTFIAPFSGVGSVTRAPVGVIRTLPETRDMLRGAMAEIVAVAQAQGVALSYAAADEALGYIDGLPEDGTASMQRDILAGRPSELHAQNGAIVRRGRAVGVGTPVNRMIVAALLPAEMKARGQRVGV